VCQPNDEDGDITPKVQDEGDLLPWSLQRCMDKMKAGRFLSTMEATKGPFYPRFGIPKVSCRKGGRSWNILEVSCKELSVEFFYRQPQLAPSISNLLVSLAFSSCFSLGPLSKTFIL
jgi:hypothetical protein